jgi:hypothetical protein
MAKKAFQKGFSLPFSVLLSSAFIELFFGNKLHLFSKKQFTLF